jgi:hypothetical protein
MPKMVAIGYRSVAGVDQMWRRSIFCLFAGGFALLASACSSAPGPDRIAAELTQRLNLQLAPEIASGQAGVQRLPDGARVTLADGTAFAPGGVTLDERGRSTVASVIEALLAPRLLQVDVSGSAAATGSIQDQQARAVTSYFEEFGIVATPLSPLPQELPPGVGAPVLTITIRATPA